MIMNRRHLLALIGASTSVSGCLSSGFTASEGETNWATGTPSSPPVQTDSDQYQSICSTGAQLSLDFDIEYSERDGFSIEAASDSVAVGDSLAFKLRNESSEERTIASSGVYDIQREADGNWKSVYKHKTPLLLERIGQIVEPDGRIVWNLTMTKIGITHLLNKESGLLACCSSLSPGSYRFIYWGLPSESSGDSKTKPSLAVQFELTEG